jgi:hypothetical protein
VLKIEHTETSGWRQGSACSYSYVGCVFYRCEKKEIYLQTSKPVYASLNKMITSLFVGDMKTGCLIYIWD